MDTEHEARHEGVVKDIERLRENDRDLFGRVSKLEQEAAEQRGRIDANLANIATQNTEQKGMLIALQTTVAALGRGPGEEARKKQAVLYAALVTGIIGAVIAAVVAALK